MPAPAPTYQQQRRYQRQTSEPPPGSNGAKRTNRSVGGAGPKGRTNCLKTVNTHQRLIDTLQKHPRKPADDPAPSNDSESVGEKPPSLSTLRRSNQPIEPPGQYAEYPHPKSGTSRAQESTRGLAIGRNALQTGMNRRGRTRKRRILTRYANTPDGKGRLQDHHHARGCGGHRIQGTTYRGIRAIRQRRLRHVVQTARSASGNNDRGAHEKSPSAASSEPGILSACIIHPQREAERPHDRHPCRSRRHQNGHH